MSRRSRKRGNGEGSIYRRKDGRWAAAVTVGYTADGSQRRKTVYAETRIEVAKKLDETKRAVEEGRPIFIERQTVAQFLDRWMSDVVSQSVRTTTAGNYGHLIRLYISPALGHIQLARLEPQHVQKFMRDLLEQGFWGETRE